MSLRSLDKRCCGIDWKDDRIAVVHIEGDAAEELPVPCIGPDGFPPVEIYYAGIPDFAYYYYLLKVVVVVAVVVEWLL